ncbi:MAG: hypothetical protein ACPGXK_06370 [Phycisphaerae bacterium]
MMFSNRRAIVIVAFAGMLLSVTGCTDLQVSEAARQSVATFLSTVVNTAINNTI